MEIRARTFATVFRGEDGGRPDIGTGWEGEAGRHDADNRHRLIVDAHDPADDAGLAAELARPGAVAQDHHRLVASDEIVRHEGAAESRGHTEDIEEAVGDPPGA